MQTTSGAWINDAAENATILDRQCAKLAYSIFNDLFVTERDAALAIKKLAENWADGTRECCALIAEEERAPVVAMAIRKQL
jgi:hypothetical protein